MAVTSSRTVANFNFSKPRVSFGVFIMRTVLKQRKKSLIRMITPNFGVNQTRCAKGTRDQRGPICSVSRTRRPPYTSKVRLQMKYFKVRATSIMPGTRSTASHSFQRCFALHRRSASSLASMLVALTLIGAWFSFCSPLFFCTSPFSRPFMVCVCNIPYYVREAWYLIVNLRQTSLG